MTKLVELVKIRPAFTFHPEKNNEKRIRRQPNKCDRILFWFNFSAETRTILIIEF